MNRRRFISGLALLALARVVAAQPAKVYRVAFIATVSPLSELTGPNPVNPGVRAFVHGLRDHGYVQGRNLILDWRTLEGKLERFEEVAADVVRLKPDVIVLVSGTLVLRFSKVSMTVPVVATIGGNESFVGTELVRSLARPGGNITGLSLLVDVGLEAKRLEMLLEVVPKAARVAILGTQESWDGGGKNALTPAAQRLGVSVFHVGTTATAASFADAFALIERERPDAVLVPLGPVSYGHRREIGQFAVTSRIPMACGTREFAEHGCLLSYGADLPDVYRRAAGYVAKILEGAKPGDLPIEQPTKFELVINLKTAKALGLTIPRQLLLRADRVIE